MAGPTLWNPEEMSPESQNRGTSNSKIEHLNVFAKGILKIHIHTFKSNPCAILWYELVLRDFLRQMVAQVVIQLESCTVCHPLHTADGTSGKIESTLEL